MSDARPALDDPNFMSALLDVLVPPHGDVPGAGALGLAPAVASGLRTDEMLGPLVEPALEGMRAAVSGGASLHDQLAANGMLVMGLLRYVYPAYYQQPQVLKAIGDEPRPPFPQGFQAHETDPELLARLEARQRAP